LGSATVRPAADARVTPLYGKRAEDVGDGSAFPEIHIAQYPLGMGRRVTPDFLKKPSASYMYARI
jgi:SNW domain-containing protein 1